MARPRLLVPSYRLHRASGQAIVTLTGEDVYLGPHRSDESRRGFDEEVAAWIARGRLPRQHAPPEHTVDDLILAYVEHTRQRFAAMGRRVELELEALKYACRPLRALCGTSLAAAFDLQKAKSVRRTFIAGGLSLSVVNRRMGYIQRMFRWGASEGLVPPAALAELLALPRLKPGESAAPIGERVEPVPQAHVAAIIPFLPPVLRAMVELQWIAAVLRAFAANALAKPGSEPVERLLARSTAQAVVVRNVAHADVFRLAREILDDVQRTLDEVLAQPRFAGRNVLLAPTACDLELLAFCVKRHTPASRGELELLQAAVRLSVDRLPEAGLRAGGGRTRLRIDTNFPIARIDEGEWFKISVGTHQFFKELIQRENRVRLGPHANSESGLLTYDPNRRKQKTRLGQKVS